MVGSTAAAGGSESTVLYWLDSMAQGLSRLEVKLRRIVLSSDKYMELSVFSQTCASSELIANARPVSILSAINCRWQVEVTFSVAPTRTPEGQPSIVSAVSMASSIAMQHRMIFSKDAPSCAFIL